MLAFREIVEVRVGTCILKKLLRGGNNERLPIRSANLSSQEMEVVGSGGRIHNLHVDLLGLLILIIQLIG